MKILKQLRAYMLPHNKNARRLDKAADQAAHDGMTILADTLREMAEELRRAA